MSVLRSYAGFLIEVLNCTSEATVYLQRADELEEQATRNTNSNIDGQRSGVLFRYIRTMTPFLENFDRKI